MMTFGRRSCEREHGGPVMGICRVRTLDFPSRFVVYGMNSRSVYIVHSRSACLVLQGSTVSRESSLSVIL
jgi:hypothetical protein